jgi:hypothetical protein
MSKKIIRLTESDIKKHIKNIVSEQDITASDIFNPISLGTKLGTKISNYMKPNQSTSGVNHTNSFGDPSIEGKINQFTVVLIKQMNYHFVQETSMHGDKVVLAKKLKYGGNMMIFVTDSGDISWNYTPQLYKGQTNQDEFTQRGKLGNVKNWNKAMITNLENGVESHVKVQGNPNQTGTQNLSENKKVVRLTESELKRYIQKIISEQSTPSPYKVGQVLQGKRNLDNQMYTIKIVRTGDGWVMAKIKGPGTYDQNGGNPLPLNGNGDFELYSRTSGKLSGNPSMGEFTII